MYDVGLASLEGAGIIVGKLTDNFPVFYKKEVDFGPTQAMSAVLRNCLW